MAKDDQNKDPEEDDFFGDDEDFGLPELDFDSLDEDDEEEFDLGDDDFSVDSDDSSDEEFGDMDDVFGDEETTEEEPEPEEETLEFEETTESEPESFDDTSEESDGDDDFDFDDFDSDDDSTTDDDLSDVDFSDDDLTSDDSLDDDEFKDFESDLMESEGEDLSDFDISDDFGSGESYAEEEPVADAGSDDDGSSKGKFARIVIIGVVIFALLGTGFLLYYKNFMVSDEEQPIAEQTEDTAPAQPQKAEENTSEENTEAKDAGVADTENTTKPATEAAKKPQQKPASKPPTKQSNTQPAQNTVASATPGEITSLTARTNNYYIVIASFLDEDLAMDHSKELAAEGKSPTIIPPFGKAITHRVAIKGYGSLAQAQNEIGNYKGEYGQDIWVLKY